MVMVAPVASSLMDRSADIRTVWLAFLVLAVTSTTSTYAASGWHSENVAVILDAPIADADLTADSVVIRRDDAVIPGSVSVVNPSEQRQTGDEDLPPLPKFPFVVLWTPDDPESFIADAYAPFSYTVTINLVERQIKSKKAHAPPDKLLADHTGELDEVWSIPQDNPILSVSQVANDRFRHARPYVDVIPNWVSLYDHRARWQHPETYRFMQMDPLGSIDSTNLYQAFGYDGFNLTDPSGEVIPAIVVAVLVAGGTSVGVGLGVEAIRVGITDDDWRYSWSDAGIDFTLGAATFGFNKYMQIGKLRHLAKLRGGQAAVRAGGEIGLDIGAEYVRCNDLVPRSPSSPIW
jgi:RHS repeat-associated protein